MKKIAISTQCQQQLADVYTPVGIYLRLRDRFRDAVLLESTDFHTAENSWSFIGVQAIAGFEVLNAETLEYKLPGQVAVRKALAKPSDMVPALHDFLDRFELHGDDTIAAARQFFGYTSYDAVQFFEQLQLKPATNGAAMPLLRYRLYQYVVAINHYKDELFVCENSVTGLQSELDALWSCINSKDVPQYPFALNGPETSNLTDEAYVDMVKAGMAATLRGNVFQIVLSRRFAQPFSGDEFNVYRALRSVNPSPYLFYFDYGDYRLFGSSPESQLIINNGKAVVHPIAGTFKRTGNDAEDQQKAEALLLDAKENAEHVMLVDLARNDLSRHATAVHVSSYRKVHYYSHVIHLVSEVTGTLKADAKAFHIMADTFPAGTLSGAPKYKAMQLIDELEPTARGYYGGAIGLLGLDGSLNHAIMIRTFLSRHNQLYYQAGAGVVAASDPHSELQEVNNKLGALKKALQKATAIGG
ncbi:MAG: anthranilate synthase component I family protein [Bacteroidetes bacterium]|nr:MAG: anthranilate synthase component I family protein [Bacteroidota bacterium]